MAATSRPIAGSARRLIRSKGMTVISTSPRRSNRHPPAIQPSTQITGRISPRRHRDPRLGVGATEMFAAAVPSGRCRWPRRRTSGRGCQTSAAGPRVQRPGIDPGSSTNSELIAAIAARITGWRRPDHAEKSAAPAGP